MSRGAQTEVPTPDPRSVFLQKFVSLTTRGLTSLPSSLEVPKDGHYNRWPNR